MGKPSTDAITTDKIGTGILILIILSAIAYAANWLWIKTKYVYYTAKSWLDTAVDTGTTLLAIIMGVFIVCMLLDLVILPIFRAIRRRLAENASLKQSVYPTLNTFRGVQQGSALDRIFTTFLAPVYLELMGAWPSREAFKNNPGEFHLFRADQLPKLVRGRYRYNVELLFRYVQAAYCEGNEKVKALLGPLIAAQCKRPALLRVTGRFLNVLSFGVFGYKSGAGYIVVEESVWAGDWNNFRGLMMRHFFPMARALEHCGVVFDSYEESSEVNEALPPSDSSPVLPKETPLLPAAEVVSFHPSPKPATEAESQPQAAETDTEDNAELEKESIETVNMVMGFFENFKDKAWGNAATLLGHMAKLLSEAAVHHTEPTFVHSKVVWIEYLRDERLPQFDAAFSAVKKMKVSDTLPDWFQNAIAHMGIELMDETTFKQCCLVHFLLAASGDATSDTADEVDDNVNDADPVVQSIGF